MAQEWVKKEDHDATLRRLETIENFVDQFDILKRAKGDRVTYVSGAAADTENSVDHGLKLVPQGFIILSVSKAAHIYKGNTPWTSSKIFLRSDVAGVKADLLLLS